MRRSVGKVLFIIALVCALAYTGSCVYGNFIQDDPASLDNPSMPDVKTAQYSFYVKNTKSLILSNDYEQFGEEAGERTFVLHGYWEMVGVEFKYRDADQPLREQDFGEIVVKRRSK